MGYSTDFTGELKFKGELQASQLAFLKGFLGEDRRDIGYKDDSVYEGGLFGNYWYHIDLELLEDFSGLKWNGAEKTCCLQDIVNWITVKVREQWPDFELEGELVAQGQTFDDRWRLVMLDGIAKKVDFPRVGDRITCPHCEEEFTLEQD